MKSNLGAGILFFFVPALPIRSESQEQRQPAGSSLHCGKHGW